ncbi:MAG: alkanesulfonate monooxygenase [Sphingomonadales bacterium]|nr:alkanesulfonate monooxygenase [Sphingomonadales bacterium]
MILPVFHRGGLPEATSTEGWGHNRGGRSLLPTFGDDDNVTQNDRVEFARAAERMGYDSILSIMTDRHYDPFVATSFLAAHTKRIKFIVALRPGTVHPTWAVRQSLTFQETSNNRLYLNIITGSHEKELRALGETLDKTERYARTSEFFDVLNLSFTGKPFDYRGKHCRDGRLQFSQSFGAQADIADFPAKSHGYTHHVCRAPRPQPTRGPERNASGP